MPTHYRNKILTELVNILNNNTNAKNRVYSNRLKSISEEELPAIILYINNEEVSRETMSRPCMLKKDINLSIEIFAGVNEEDLDNQNNNIPTVDEVINEIAGQIETLIANNYKLNDLVLDIKYTNFEMILNNESSYPKGIAKMTYLITYRCLDNEPFI